MTMRDLVCDLEILNGGLKIFFLEIIHHVTLVVHCTEELYSRLLSNNVILKATHTESSGWHCCLTAGRSRVQFLGQPRVPALCAVCMFSPYLCGFPRGPSVSPTVQIKSTGYPKSPSGVNVAVYGCLSMCYPCNKLATCPEYSSPCAQSQLGLAPASPEPAMDKRHRKWLTDQFL